MLPFFQFYIIPSLWCHLVDLVRAQLGSRLKEELTNQRGKHHHEAGAQVDIDGLHVRDLWQLGVGCAN